VTDVPYLYMRRPLTGLLEAAIWPEGTQLISFSEDCARACHTLLELAYQDGGGSVPAFAKWWGSLAQDSEYDPALCFPVHDGEGRLVGFAQCWTTGFVKDLVVHPSHRRRGIGRALLTHIFQVFRQKGAKAVCLKVEASNRSGAIQLYENLGMCRVAAPA
jgi:ribosomal protein S18 acetylase RimI-like enzyme